jgi:hypothetical protein
MTGLFVALTLGDFRQDWTLQENPIVFSPARLAAANQQVVQSHQALRKLNSRIIRVLYARSAQSGPCFF